MKTRIITILLLLVFTLTTVNAAVQSRPGVTPMTGGGISGTNSFFQQSREMEMLGGALGLSATFKKSNNTYVEVSQSNSIDAHMIKNTEWGAIAMLSASPYGAGNGSVTKKYDETTLIYDKTASTTGNMTGVFGMNNDVLESELVAAGIPSKMDSTWSLLINAANRYMDKYKECESNDKYEYIPGDATKETEIFAGNQHYLSNEYPYFSRGVYSVFQFRNESYYTGSYKRTRAVIWNGVGL